MRFKRFVLGFVSATIAAGSVSATVIEDFEGSEFASGFLINNDSPWQQDDTPAGPAPTVIDPLTDGNHVGSFQSNSAAYFLSNPATAFDDAGTVIYEFDFVPLGTGDGAGSGVDTDVSLGAGSIIDGVNAGDIFAGVRFGSDGSIFTRSGFSQGATTGTWTQNTSYVVSLVIDLDADSFDVLLNGVEIASDVAAPADRGLDSFIIRTNNANGNGSREGGFIIDNISVVPEPGSVMLLSAGVGLLALRRRRSA